MGLHLSSGGGGSATLPKVASTVSASGAAVVAKHNPVDASGATRAISLPTGQAEGTEVSVEKVDTSANLVNVTGSIRGVGSSTLPLAWQFESIMLRADSTGSWWPVAGHKTKSSMDNAFGRGVSILAYGATTGAANNATAIQAAIDAMASAGGGRVHVPKGTWLTGPLSMKTRVTLAGEGWASKLQLINGANVDFVTLADTGQFECGVEQLALDGNKANQSAGSVVHFDNASFAGTGNYSSSLGDPNHHMTRVLLANGKEHGAYIAGSLGGGQYRELFLYKNDKHGVYLTAPDNEVSASIATTSGWDNFRVEQNSNRIQFCKAFLAGAVDSTTYGSGFSSVNINRTDFIGCEAQDNRRHGFTLLVGTNLNMVACRADRNGLGPEPVTGFHGSGLFYQNVTQSTMEIVSGDRNTGTVYQSWGVQAAGTNTGNILRATIGNYAQASPTTGNLGTGVINITVSGAQVARQDSPRTTTTQTGSYTFIIDDGGTVVEGNSAGGITFTVPPNSSVAFPIGTEIEVSQIGTGQVTLAPGAGVLLPSRGSLLKTAGQYGVVSLRKRATDQWIVTGDLSA